MRLGARPDHRLQSVRRWRDGVWALLAGAVLVALASCSRPHTSHDAGTQTSLVRFVGRVDTSDPNSPRFAWSGSGLVARFDGTFLAVRLGGGQEYTVVVDGVVGPKLVPTGGFDLLAQGLAPGVHQVELYRRTEAHLGE